MFSRVKYQSLSGTNTPPDFVEYPSQYNEMWADEPAVIANYAKHYQTGAAIPAPLLNRVLAARKFNQGFMTSEYIAAAILDQSWHQVPAAAAGEASANPPSKCCPSRPLRSRLRASISRPCRRAITAPISYTSSPADTRPATTLISGVTCWLVTPKAGCTRMAVSSGKAVISCERKCYRAAAVEEPAKLFQDFYGRPPNIEPLLEKRGLSPRLAQTASKTLNHEGVRTCPKSSSAKPQRRQHAARAGRAYQTEHVFLGRIAEPTLHENASPNCGMFVSGPRTRKRGGECGLVWTTMRSKSGR